MTEEAILQGCLKNNAAAQKALYEKYSAKMLVVCYRYAHNREDAEDMLQEGFIKVFSQIHTFENRGALEGWIRRIVVHTCINILKKNKRFNESVDLIHANSIQVREESYSIHYAGERSCRVYPHVAHRISNCVEPVRH